MGRDSRDKSEHEHFKGIIRNLKAENRHLKKQLARANKTVNKVISSNFEDLEDFIVEPPSKSKAPKCEKCGGAIKIIDLNVRIVHSCLNKDCLNKKVFKT